MLILALCALPVLAFAAPLPLSKDEIETLTAGAAEVQGKLQVSFYTDKKYAAAVVLIQKLCGAGKVEALDLILSLESEWLLDQCSLRNIPPAELEKRIIANYDKALLSARLLEGMESYQSRELYGLLLADASAYLAERYVPKRAPTVAVARAWDHIRERRMHALNAIIRTDLKGIEADVTAIVVDLSHQKNRRDVPPLMFAKFIADRNYAPAAPRLISVLKDIISQGPPYAVGELGPFAAIVAGMRSLPGSRAAAAALVEIAKSPPAPYLADAMTPVITQLGRTSPGTEVDLDALEEQVLRLAPEDGIKLGEAFEEARRARRLTQEPDADFVARAMRESGPDKPQRVRYLISKIGNVNQRTTDGRSLLGRADSLETLMLLLDRGADVRSRDSGNTPLHEIASSRPASVQETGKMIDVLIRHGADVNAVRPDGYTPLHLAVLAGQPEVAGFLIDAGANVNAVTLGGWTPLHIATGWKLKKLVELLVERGANLNAESSEQLGNPTSTHGLTPLQLAEDVGATDIAAFLRSRGATVSHGFSVKRSMMRGIEAITPPPH